MPRLGQMKFTHHLGRPFHAFAVLVADAHDLLCKTAAHEGLDGLHKEILSLMKEAKVPKEACPSSPQTARRILASVDPELNDKLDPILSVRRGPNARALAIVEACAEGGGCGGGGDDEGVGHGVLLFRILNASPRSRPSARRRARPRGARR